MPADRVPEVPMPALDRRERIPELMDDPDLDPAEHRHALAGLARINRFSRSDVILWPPIRKLAYKVAHRPLRVLDVATGSGDVPVALERKARSDGLAIQFQGCDISLTALAVGEATGSGVEFFQHDAIRDPLPTGFDVVICSLFLHHLSEADAVTLLRRMKEAAGRLLLVNDLARSRFNYLAVSVACHILSRSRVVRFDGPASVRSAFTLPEALTIAQRAGLTGATVARRWPCRYLLSWRQDART